MLDTSDKYEPRDEVSPEAMDNLVNTLRDAGREKEREKPLETERGPVGLSSRTMSHVLQSLECETP